MMTLFLRSPPKWAVAGVALVASLCSTAAYGQERHLERGVAQDRSFWSPRPTSAESSRADMSRQPDVRQPELKRVDPRQEDPSQLYADARADLDAAQYASAQRRLEVLVARFPNSPLADVARRDLQRLYTSALGAAPAQGTAMPAAVLQPAQLAAPAAPLPPPPSTLRDASEDFRHLAGDRIFFADSSVDLGGRAKVALEAQAAWLVRHPGIEIVIEGHSDDHGSRDFNSALAGKRAFAVKLRLNDLGVSTERMSIVSFGRDRPVADCAEAHCSAQNRRVITTITRVPPGLTFELTRGPNGLNPNQAAPNQLGLNQIGSNRAGPDRNTGVPLR